MGVSVVRPAAEVYAIQNDVVKQVAKALSVSLNPLQKKTLDKLPTQHTGAYEAFLEAKWIYQTKSPPENVYQAIAYLEKAAVLDSNFIGAYEYMASILPDLAGGWGDQSIENIYPKVQSLLQRTEIHPFYENLRYETQGWVYVWFYQLERADFYFRKATEANLNAEGGPASLSICLRWQGKFKEAIQWGQ
jgi:hypothetical protein